MKEINQILFAAVLLVFFTVLISCNTEKVGSHNNGVHQYAIKENGQEQSNNIQEVPDPELIEATAPEAPDVPGLVVEAPKEITMAPSPAPKIMPLAKTEIVLPEVKTEIPDAAPARKFNKEVKKEIRKILKNEQAVKTNVIGKALLVIFSIVLPPLAVALVDGFSGPFWLDLLLTILFYLPGIIYALYRVLRTGS